MATKPKQKLVNNFGFGCLRKVARQPVQISNVHRRCGKQLRKNQRKNKNGFSLCCAVWGVEARRLPRPPSLPPPLAISGRDLRLSPLRSLCLCHSCSSLRRCPEISGATVKPSRVLSLPINRGWVCFGQVDLATPAKPVLAPKALQKIEKKIEKKNFQFRNVTESRKKVKCDWDCEKERRAHRLQLPNTI